MQILLLLILTIAAHSEDIALHMISVGADGGYRVAVDCNFPVPNSVCAVDTGSSDSTVGETPETLKYPTRKTVSSGSVGLTMTCDVIEVGDLAIGGLPMQPSSFERCKTLPTNFALLGLDVFGTRTIAFDFKNQVLQLDIVDLKPSQTLVRGGPENKWLTFTASIGSTNFFAAIDTGSPVSLADRAFVLANPKYFRKSTLPPSAMQIRRQLDRYEILAPIIVNGIELQAQFVDVGDLSQFSPNPSRRLDILLGANHFAGTKWSFDLAHNLWAITR